MNVNLCMGCMQPMEEGKYCANCGFCEEEYTYFPHQLPLRTILNGKYMIGKVLGEGGFGITYLGWDLNLEMKVAIKEYYPREIVTRMSDVSLSVSVLSGGVRQPYEEGVEKFMNEAKRLARLSHLPGIVMVRDFFQENRTAYIVMEYMDGNSMKDMLRERNGRISMEETMAMILPVMDSLEKVHEVGIIHRDISPNNLMFNQYGQVKLIDFGAARYVMAANRTGMDRKSLSVIFTPGYAPVEQYSSKGNQGPWTDVYAICATIFRAITGRVPEESLDRLNGVEQPSPSMLGVKDITPSQEAALMKGLALQPQDRYRTITELKEALLYHVDEDGQEDKQEDDNLKVNQDNKTEIDNSEKTHENDKEKEEKQQEVKITGTPAKLAICAGVMFIVWAVIKNIAFFREGFVGDGGLWGWELSFMWRLYHDEGAVILSIISIIWAGLLVFVLFRRKNDKLFIKVIIACEVMFLLSQVFIFVYPPLIDSVDNGEYFRDILALQYGNLRWNWYIFSCIICIFPNIVAVFLLYCQSKRKRIILLILAFGCLFASMIWSLMWNPMFYYGNYGLRDGYFYFAQFAWMGSVEYMVLPYSIAVILTNIVIYKCPPVTIRQKEKKA
ncbi:MAG: serine/threonine protein kinase [Oliverpabstia sp.]